MLNRIRNLSTSPVILIMFGMLILVFVLFFGMPSMGGSAGNTVYHVPSKVFNAEVKLNEARAYVNRFRFNRDNAFEEMKDRFKKVQEVVMLDEVAKSAMGWESTDEQAERYMTQSSNFDHYLFGKVEVELEDLNSAFTKSLKDSKGETDGLGGRQLAQKYLDFSRKARGFSAKNMRDVLENWGLDSDEYLEIKAREMRVRSYLNFLKSQVKVSQAAAEDSARQAKLKWNFEYVLLGADHIAEGEAITDQAAQEYVKTHEGEISSYYTTNILDYSKSKLAFTQVMANYKNEAEAAKARALVDEAHAQIKAGKDPSKVGAELSKKGTQVKVYTFGNKTRKSTETELFDEALNMKPNQLTEVRDSNRNAQNDKRPSSGNYSFIRVDKVDRGDEKKLAEVKVEIAKILMARARRLEGAQKLAGDLRAQVIGGASLSALIDAHNAQLGEGSTLKTATLAESGDITLTGLVSNRLGNVGTYPIAARQLLNEVMGIDADHRVASLMKIKDQWALLVLKERVEPDFSKELDRAMSSAQSQARGEFFGRAWSSFILTGDQEPMLIRLMPMEVLIKLSSEISQGEGFIDEIIKSQYSKHVEDAPEVIRFLNQPKQRG